MRQRWNPRAAFAGRDGRSSCHSRRLCPGRADLDAERDRHPLAHLHVEPHRQRHADDASADVDRNARSLAKCDRQSDHDTDPHCNGDGQHCQHAQRHADHNEHAHAASDPDPATDLYADGARLARAHDHARGRDADVNVRRRQPQWIHGQRRAGLHRAGRSNGPGGLGDRPTPRLDCRGHRADFCPADRVSWERDGLRAVDVCSLRGDADGDALKHDSQHEVS